MNTELKEFILEEQREFHRRLRERLKNVTKGEMLDTFMTFTELEEEHLRGVLMRLEINGLKGELHNFEYEKEREGDDKNAEV